MSSLVSCLCMPIEPPAWILHGMILPLSLMYILAVILPVPPFIPGTVISFISLKSISMLPPPFTFFSCPAAVMLPDICAHHEQDQTADNRCCTDHRNSCHGIELIYSQHYIH